MKLRGNFILCPFKSQNTLTWKLKNSASSQGYGAMATFRYWLDATCVFVWGCFFVFFLNAPMACPVAMRTTVTTPSDTTSLLQASDWHAPLLSTLNPLNRRFCHNELQIEPECWSLDTLVNNQTDFCHWHSSKHLTINTNVFRSSQWIDWLIHSFIDRGLADLGQSAF